MHTIHRSCMTAGTGYGLAPFVKVRSTGFYIINRDIDIVFCISRKIFENIFTDTKYAEEGLTNTIYCGTILL